MCGVFVDDYMKWWLVFVLGVDATLYAGCGFWEHLHSWHRSQRCPGLFLDFEDAWVYKSLRLPIHHTVSEVHNSVVVVLWLYVGSFSESEGSQFETYG